MIKFKINKKLTNKLKSAKVVKKGVVYSKWWTKGYENGSALVYNMDFDTKKEAIDAALKFLAR